jgi:hypothetical protein
LSRYVSDRLIQDDGDERALLFTRAAIDFYFRVAADTRPEYIDDLAIDTNPTVDDPLLGFSPGTKPKLAKPLR